MLKKFFFILVMLISLPAWAKLPYVPLEFPRDDAAHYANTPYTATDLQEWWYLSGKVTAENGRNFGYYLIYSYFQKEVLGKKILVPMFSIQITDIDKQKVYGTRKVILPLDSLDTHNLDIAFGKNITLKNDNGVYVATVAIKSDQGPMLHLSLRLLPERPVVLPGNTGFMRSWGNSSMYYYSQPHLNTAGTLQIDNEKFTLDSQHSLSWMNRQWLDMILSRKTQWLWASAQLDNNIDLDLFQVVDPDTKKIYRHSANILMPDGSKIFTDNIIYRARPIPPGHKYPQVYDLWIPKINLQLTFTASVPDQDVDGLWEGVNDIQGLYQGRGVKGYGYTENTES